MPDSVLFIYYSIWTRLFISCIWCSFFWETTIDYTFVSYGARFKYCPIVVHFLCYMCCTYLCCLSNFNKFCRPFSFFAHAYKCWNVAFFITSYIGLADGCEVFKAQIFISDLVIQSKLSCFLMQFALPHIMGWDRLTHDQSGGMHGHQSKLDPQVLNLEWSKWIARWSVGLLWLCQYILWRFWFWRPGCLPKVLAICHRIPCDVRNMRT